MLSINEKGAILGTEVTSSPCAEGSLKVKAKTGHEDDIESDCGEEGNKAVRRKQVKGKRQS